MVKILQSSFLYWMNVPEHVPFPTTDEEMYSNILKDLENAGMLLNCRMYPETGEYSTITQMEKDLDLGVCLEWEQE